MRERIRARASYGSDALVYGSHVAGGAVILAASCQLIGQGRLVTTGCDHRRRILEDWRKVVGNAQPVSAFTLHETFSGN